MENSALLNKPDTTFEEALEANKERIFRVCRIYTLSPLAPEDLFQEVVFQVWKSFSTFRGNSGIDTWIYKIALNVCQRSKLKNEKGAEKTIRLSSLQFIPADQAPDANEQEKYLALQDCIATLNQGDQSIIVLLLEGLPYKQIAEIIGLTDNHIAVKMKRIRKLLFDCITPKLS
jgi:RNA polymerase sigma-70 factor (ECF subfamily)